MRRRNTGFFGRTEETILYKLVRLVPKWVTPDLLTLAAFLSALLAGIGYVFVRKFPSLFLLINFLIFFHWLTDGLDGKLAKIRKIARPNYGFYIDHLCDCFSLVFINSGILLSSLANPLIIFFITVIALLSLIHSYLRTVATETFYLSIGPVGGTEMRIALILANFIIYFYGNPTLLFFNFTLTMFDVIWLLAILTFIPILTKTVFFTAIRLNSQDIKKREKSKSIKRKKS